MAAEVDPKTKSYTKALPRCLHSNNLKKNVGANVHKVLRYHVFSWLKANYANSNYVQTQDDVPHQELCKTLWTVLTSGPFGTESTREDCMEYLGAAPPPKKKTSCSKVAIKK